MNTILICAVKYKKQSLNLVEDDRKNSGTTYKGEDSNCKTSCPEHVGRIIGSKKKPCIDLKLNIY